MLMLKNRLLKFLIPSLLGLLLFIIPLPYGKIIPIDGISSVNIGIGLLAEIFKLSLSRWINHLALIVIVGSALLTIISYFIKIKSTFWHHLLKVSPFWAICRILGAIFITMTLSGTGHEIITSPDTGETMLGILPSLLAIFFVSGFLLPLVVDFGLMDLLGTLISRSMTKLFRVPGRSAIDAISSWLGDGTLGIMITDMQLRNGYYTKREAAIISVCFSLVSLPFSTVIADQLGLMDMFVPFYLTVSLASFACALIIPRIPPISRIEDTTLDNIEHKKEQVVDKDANIYKFALDRAMDRAADAPSITTILKQGIKGTLDMYIALLPLVMAWGTIALIIANFTPFFQYLSYPLVHVLDLFNVDNAEVAAPAILVGFTDMFIPSIMVSGADVSDATKFIVGAISISQLVYLTETGAVILKSRIPLNLKKIFIVFLLRSAISLPIIIIASKVVFG